MKPRLKSVTTTAIALALSFSVTTPMLAIELNPYSFHTSYSNNDALSARAYELGVKAVVAGVGTFTANDVQVFTTPPGLHRLNDEAEVEIRTEEDVRVILDLIALVMEASGIEVPLTWLDTYVTDAIDEAGFREYFNDGLMEVTIENAKRNIMPYLDLNDPLQKAEFEVFKAFVESRGENISVPLDKNSDASI